MIAQAFEKPLSRSDIGELPVVPQKVEPFAPLKGSVTVRGLLLAEQMANGQLAAAERTPRNGETEAEALARANGVCALRVVSQAVIDPDGGALLTLAEWQALGAAHPAEVLALAGVAMGLSGASVGAAEKN